MINFVLLYSDISEFLPFEERDGFVCPSVRPSRKRLSITLPFLNIFSSNFHIILLVHRHADAEFFRSRSHLPALCPLMLTFYLNKTSEDITFECSTEHPSSFFLH